MAQAKAIEDHDDDGLKNIIANHERAGKLKEPRYAAALAELDRRKGQGLNFETSLQMIREAASEYRYVSYKALADASGAEWSKVHYAMNEHLGRLIKYAHQRGWPMLSAIVVNKEHVRTGKMEPETLKGFVEAARWLGYAVADEQAFLRDQQRLVFEWARGPLA